MFANISDYEKAIFKFPNFIILYFILLRPKKHRKLMYLEVLIVRVILLVLMQ